MGGLSGLVRHSLLSTAVVGPRILANQSRALSAQTADPARAVVVCISGYQSSSLHKDKNTLEQIRYQAQIAGKDPKAAVREYELIAEQLNTSNSSDDGPSGMENLRKKIADHLRDKGTPDDRIIHAQWSERSPGRYDLEPVYNKLAQSIRDMSPSSVGIIGHSYGGWTACRLSRAIGMPPSYLALFDPMFSYTALGTQSGPQNAHVDNFPIGNGEMRSWYQRGGRPHGYSSVHRDNKDGPSIRNDHVGGNHTTIDDDEGLHWEVMTGIDRMLAQQTAVYTTTPRPGL